MEANYASLEKGFMSAVRAQNAGETDKALKLFKEVLLSEPRLPEPRLEVASILFDKGDLEEAEAHAREALHWAEAGWHWLDDFTEGQLMAYACNLVAEILKARTLDKEGLKQGEDVIRRLWREAGKFIARAARYDSDNLDVMANFYAFEKWTRMEEGR
jgi:tetratricopeptide (TPR) repeat protein